MTGTASTIAPQGTGIAYFTSILEQFSYGDFAGPAEMLGGIVLFLTARRTIARTLGLLLFIGVLTGYANGYNLVEMLTILSNFLGETARFLQAAVPASA